MAGQFYLRGWLSLIVCLVLSFLAFTDACVNGKYGPDCLESCGNCAQGTAQCDTASGNCPDRPNLPRCRPGFSGQKCKTPCADWRWGADCLLTCGQCFDGAVCNRSTKVCPISVGGFRCAAGYNGTQCVTTCTPGTWGQNCKLTCSFNCKGGPTGCDFVSGECTGGCLAGYGGFYCQQISDEDYTGPITGGVVGAVLLLAIVIAVIVLMRRRTGQPQQPIELSSVATPESAGQIREQDESRDHHTPDYYNTDSTGEPVYESVAEKQYEKLRSPKVNRDQESVS